MLAGCARREAASEKEDDGHIRPAMLPPAGQVVNMAFPMAVCQECAALVLVPLESYHEAWHAKQSGKGRR